MKLEERPKGISQKNEICLHERTRWGRKGVTPPKKTYKHEDSVIRGKRLPFIRAKENDRKLNFKKHIYLLV